MLGTDKSRGDCLEMICADFLEGANHEWLDPMIVRIIRTVFLPAWISVKHTSETAVARWCYCPNTVPDMPLRDLPLECLPH
jgi:hypothetical protein